MFDGDDNGVTYEELLEGPAAIVRQGGNTEAVGGDILDGMCDILDKTLECTDDLKDLSETVVPLASALLDISERTGDEAKLMKSHSVLSQVAHMGIW